jgi:hypothetical protein
MTMKIVLAGKIDNYLFGILACAIVAYTLMLEKIDKVHILLFLIVLAWVDEVLDGLGVKHRPVMKLGCLLLLPFEGIAYGAGILAFDLGYEVATIRPATRGLRIGSDLLRS